MTLLTLRIATHRQKRKRRTKRKKKGCPRSGITPGPSQWPISNAPNAIHSETLTEHSSKYAREKHFPQTLQTLKSLVATAQKRARPARGSHRSLAPSLPRRGHGAQGMWKVDPNPFPRQVLHAAEPLRRARCVGMSQRGDSWRGDGSMDPVVTFQC